MQYLDQGTFFITGGMLALNYPGYPAYFMAPIYIAGGAAPPLIHIAQLVLHAHIAMMLYTMVRAVEVKYQSAKYVFFFALFFPDTIALSLYLRKDVLILWCIVVVLMHTTHSIRYGFTLKRALLIGLITSYLAILRMPYALVMLVPTCFAVADQPAISRRISLFLKVFSVLLIVPLFKSQIESAYIGASALMATETAYGEGRFGYADTPFELLAVLRATPLKGIWYILVVVGAFFFGGFAALRAIRDLFSDIHGLHIAGRIFALGSAWRFINLPFTLFGVWILVRHHRRGMGPLLVFTVLLMIIMFVIGYGGRWGLAGMIINCVAWGIGYARIMKRKQITQR